VVLLLLILVICVGLVELVERVELHTKIPRLRGKESEGAFSLY